MDMLSPQTQFVFHDAATLDATDRMFYTHANAIDASIFFLFCGGQVAATRLLLWLDDHNASNLEALKSPILIQRGIFSKSTGAGLRQFP